MSEKLEPWERLDGETERAWEAFVVYRSLPPPRAVIKARKALGEKGATVNEWSRKHNWVERARAYDRAKDRERVEADFEMQREAVREMGRRHIDLTSKVYTIAKLETARVLNALGDDPKAQPSVRISELRDLVRDVIKLERLVRGEPEDVQRFNVAPSQPTLSEAIAQVEELAKK